MDEYDDFFDKIKKYFNIDSDFFDVDFLFIPESENSLNLTPENDNLKAFKISYHFERGMEKPDVRIKGNIDKRQIRDYLNNIDLSKDPSLKKIFDASNKEEIDVNNLSLDFSENMIDLPIVDPDTEINNYNEYAEIILDIPGINKEDVLIEFKRNGTELIFSAENINRKYNKILTLPFKCNLENCKIEVKNGLAIINIKRLDY
ncbi:MAG: Hsp20/alpha crystallin family protein [Candidatus Thorarchaeota archaeon]